MPIQDNAITDGVRNEVSKLMDVDADQVKDHNLSVSVSSESKSFHEKAQIYFNEKLTDHIDQKQATYLSLQIAEHNSRNLIQYAENTRMPGNKDDIAEASRKVSFNINFPEFVARELENQVATKNEKADLSRGMPGDSATITEATPTKEKSPANTIYRAEQVTKQDIGKPESGLDENVKRDIQQQELDVTHKRKLDTLRMQSHGVRDIYKSPLTRQDIIEADPNRITMYGASQLAADSVIDLAEDKGWKAISVNGSTSTKQAIWMAGSARGMEVKGYEPTTADRQWLDKKTGRSATVEEIKIRNKKPEKTEKETVIPFPNKTEQAAAPAPSTKSTGKYTGVLIEHGEDRFKHNNKANPSYYAKLETQNGHTIEVWGKDIQRAISDSGAKPLDEISLSITGSEQVSVPVAIKDDDGKTIGTEMKEAKLNTWKTEVLEKHKPMGYGKSTANEKEVSIEL